MFSFQNCFQNDCNIPQAHLNTPKTFPQLSRHPNISWSKISNKNYTPTTKNQKIKYNNTTNELRHSFPVGTWTKSTRKRARIQRLPSKTPRVANNPIQTPYPHRSSKKTPSLRRRAHFFVLPDPGSTPVRRRWRADLRNWSSKRIETRNALQDVAMRETGEMPIFKVFASGKPKAECAAWGGTEARSAFVRVMLEVLERCHGETWMKYGKEDDSNLAGKCWVCHKMPCGDPQTFEVMEGCAKKDFWKVNYSAKWGSWTKFGRISIQALPKTETTS